jgi:hypothetical protein
MRFRAFVGVAQASILFIKLKNISEKVIKKSRSSSYEQVSVTLNMQALET